MFLILRFFNSIIFVIANLSVALFTLQRTESVYLQIMIKAFNFMRKKQFFRAMKVHYQLVDEVQDFSNLVDQSRSSLDFVGTKVMEAMKEMEADIGKEVYVTHNLTKLSSKVASVTTRFNEVEEGIIELARLNHNVENATVETPSDINEEVRRILITLKRKNPGSNQQQNSTAHHQLPQLQPPRSPHKISRTGMRSTRNHAIISEPGQIQLLQQNSAQPSSTAVVKLNRRPPSRSHSPTLVPDVMLLDEQRHTPAADKSIGFRPPWMCQV